VLVLHVPLRDGVEAWFTGRDLDRPDPAVGRAGNLSHHRPHRPSDLARDRAAAAEAMALEPGSFHLMRQCHGAEVGVVGAATPVGAELEDVDVLVSSEPDRPLAVAVADCVPVLLGGQMAVAAVHAGRQGVLDDAVGAALAAMEQAGDRVSEIDAAIGPAIGGCCYEVPADLQDEVATRHPAARSTTTWGTPSLDLPAAVRRRLEDAGVTAVTEVGSCTRCDPEGRWFSHRRDPDTGRQLGVVVRRTRGEVVRRTRGEVRP
jgi:polyphenol oxidase